tara:strand:+ start:275 stop:523 length:249 start_codon:yes stop_codon:yes gene_type:complete
MKHKKHSLRKIKSHSKINSKQNHKNKIDLIKKENKKLKSLKDELQSIHKTLGTYSNNHHTLEPKELDIKLSLLDKKKILQHS